MKKGTKRLCINGHTFYKSSGCPTCPICEKSNKPPEGFLSLLSAPARRALEGAEITTLQKLATYSEKEILALHGMGPASIPTLKICLEKEGRIFRKI